MARLKDMAAVERRLSSPRSSKHQCCARTADVTGPYLGRGKKMKSFGTVLVCLLLASLTMFGGFYLASPQSSLSRLNLHGLSTSANQFRACDHEHTQRSRWRHTSQLPLLSRQMLDSGGPAVSAFASQHLLTWELASSRAHNNVVVVTWANYHYRDFVMNWVEHLLATGCRSFLVGAMDDELLRFLLDRQVPVFSMGSGPTTEQLVIGTSSFNQMGREKVLLIHTFLSLGLAILVSDVDTVWLRNPLPFLERYPSADILATSDLLTPTVSDEGLEVWERARQYPANIGVILFRPPAKTLTEEWMRVVLNHTDVWDQQAFNELLARGWEPLQDDPDRLFMAYDATLRAGILPVTLFCSGHVFFLQRLPHRLGVQPFVVHAIFQVGQAGKRMRLREALLFNDPPEYYFPEGGFLAYDPALPQQLLDACQRQSRNGSLEATLPHFDLVNYQLVQARAQFALAELLGRAAILAPFWCGMDRWWHAHNGVVRGSHLQLPFQCPADHILDVDAIEKDGVVAIREHSLLANPRSATLLGNTLTVVVCKERQVGCGDGSEPAEVMDGVLKLKPGLQAAKIHTALSDVGSKYKVLRFQGIERALGGWDTRTQEREFERRLRNYTTSWCCAQPGRVWYDFFWDKVPHIDRHARLIDRPWTPQAGP